MLTVKMIKYRRSQDGMVTEDIEKEFIRESRSTLVTCEPDNVRILQLGDATPGESTAYRLGTRSDCQFDVAYLINENGQAICKL